MIKKISAAAFAAAAISFAGAALADDIPATPMNHGPMVMHGMGPMGDIANIGLTPFNVLAPAGLAVGGAAANAGGQIVGAGPVVAANEPEAAGPMKHKHHHKHAMMKKKMMKKKM